SEWSYEPCFKSFTIYVSMKPVKVKIDLRRPIKDCVHLLAKQHKIVAWREYSLQINLNPDDMKNLVNTKKEKTILKTGKRIEQKKHDLKTSDTKIWVDESKTFSDDENIENFPNAIIELNRIVFLSDNSIQMHNKGEAEVMYSQLKSMLKNGHFKSLNTETAISLVQIIITIDSNKSTANIKPKEIISTDYLPKDHSVNSKKILENINKYGSHDLLDLKYIFLDTMRKMPEWGCDKFLVTDATESSKTKDVLIEISKNGLKKMSKDSKMLGHWDLIQIVKYRYQSNGISIRMNTNHEEFYITEDSNKITGILSRIIDLVRANKSNDLMSSGNNRKVMSEKVNEFSFLRNKKSDEAKNIENGLKVSGGYAKLVQRVRMNRGLNLAENYGQGSAGLNGLIKDGMGKTIDLSSLNERNVASAWQMGLQDVLKNLSSTLNENFEAEMRNNPFIYPTDDLSAITLQKLMNDLALADSGLVGNSMASLLAAIKDIENSNVDQKEAIKRLYIASQSLIIDMKSSSNLVKQNKNLVDINLNKTLGELAESLMYINLYEGLNQANMKLFDTNIEHLYGINLQLARNDNLFLNKELIYQLIHGHATALRSSKDELEQFKDIDLDKSLQDLMNDLNLIAFKIDSDPDLIFNSENVGELIMLLSATAMKSKKLSNEFSDPTLRDLLNDLSDKLQTDAFMFEATSETSLEYELNTFHSSILGEKSLENLIERSVLMYNKLSNDELINCVNIISDKEKDDLNECLKKLFDEIERLKQIENTDNNTTNETAAQLYSQINLIKPDITRVIQKRDALYSLEAMNKHMLPLVSLLCSLSQEDINPDDIDRYYSMVVSFYNINELFYASSYDLKLFQNSPDCSDQDISDLLYLYSRILPQIATNLVVDYASFSSSLKPDSKAKLIMNQRVENLAKEIARTTLTPDRENINVHEISQMMLKNHKDTVKSKKKPEDLREFSSGKDTPQFVAQNLMESVTTLAKSMNENKKRFENQPKSEKKYEMKSKMILDMPDNAILVSAIINLSKRSFAGENDPINLEELLQNLNKLIESFEKIGNQKSKVGGAEVEQLEDVKIKNLKDNLASFCKSLPVNSLISNSTKEAYAHVKETLNDQKEPLKNAEILSKHSERLSQNLGVLISNIYSILQSDKTLYIDIEAIIKNLSDTWDLIIEDMQLLGIINAENSTINDQINSLIDDTFNFTSEITTISINDSIYQTDEMLASIANLSSKILKIVEEFGNETSINMMPIEITIGKLLQYFYKLTNNAKGNRDASTNIPVLYSKYDLVHDGMVEEVQKLIATDKISESMANTEDSLDNLTDCIKNILEALTEYQDESSIILPLDNELNYDSFDKNMDDVVQMRYISAIGNTEKFVTDMRKCSDSVAKIAKGSFGNYIQGIQKEIDSILNEIVEELKSEYPDSITLTQKRTELSQKVKTQLRNFSEPPCVNPKSIGASAKSVIHQDFSRLLSQMINVLQVKLILERQEEGFNTIQRKELTKNVEALTSLLENLKKHMRDIHPIEVATESLKQLIHKETLLQISTTKRTKADVISSEMSSSPAIKSLSNHFLMQCKNAITTVVQHISLVKSNLSNKKVEEVNTLNIVDSLQSIKWLLRILNDQVDLLNNCTSKKECLDLCDLFNTAATTLSKSTDSIKTQLTNPVLSSHDYNQTVKQLDKANEAFKNMLNEFETRSNAFSALHGYEDCILQGISNLKVANKAVDKTQSVEDLQIQLRKDLIDLSHLLKNLASNIDDPQSCVVNVDKAGTIYKDNIIPTFHAIQAVSTDSDLVTSIRNALEDFGRCFHRFVSLKAKNNKDDENDVKELLNTSEQFISELLDLSEKLSRIAQEFESLEQFIQTLASSLDRIAENAYKKTASDPLLSMNEGKEEASAIISDLNHFKSEFDTLLNDVLISGDKTQSLEDFENKIGKIKSLEKENVARILKFMSNTLRSRNEFSDSSELVDFLNTSPLLPYLTAQQRLISDLKSKLGKNISKEELSTLEKSFSDSHESLMSYIQNIEEASFSKNAYFLSMGNKISSMSSNIQNKKIKPLPTNKQNFEEIDLMLKIALDSLKQALTDDMKNKENDDPSKLINSSDLFTSSMEDFIGQTWSLRSNVDKNIQNHVDEKLLNVLNSMNCILTNEIERDTKVESSQAEINTMNQKFDEIDVNLSDLMSILAIRKEKEEDAAETQEKIKKSDAKLRKTINKFKEMTENKLGINMDEIEPEKRDLIRLIMITIGTANSLMVLHADILDHLKSTGDTSAMSLRYQMTQSHLNSMLGDILDTYLQTTKYFIGSKMNSQKMLLNSTVNVIRALIHKSRFRSFIKLKAPGFINDNNKLSYSLHNDLEEVESILKTTKFAEKDSAQNMGVKDLIERFRIEADINKTEIDVTKNKF
ncbi:MAG: Talin-2, partial [Paramarteilia canceri]